MAENHQKNNNNYLEHRSHYSNKFQSNEKKYFSYSRRNYDRKYNGTQRIYQKNNLNVQDLACCVCLEPMKIWSIGECNHTVVCMECTLRRRIIYEKLECSLCKTQLPFIMLLSQQEIPNYATNKVNFQELFQKLSLSQDSTVPGVFFPTNSSISDSFNNLKTKKWNLSCQICLNEKENEEQSAFDSLDEYRIHLSMEHFLHFCSLCLNYRNVFLHEQILYNEHDLQLHIEKGSEKHQIKHEKCTFCGTLTFDLDQIYFHLYNYHSVCTICQQNGVQFCFFNSEYEREKHCKLSHFPCLNSNCKNKVFSTQLDLELHNATYHKLKKKRGTKINLDFVVNGAAINPSLPKFSKDEMQNQNSKNESNIQSSEQSSFRSTNNNNLTNNNTVYLSLETSGSKKKNLSIQKKTIIANKNSQYLNARSFNANTSENPWRLIPLEVYMEMFQYLKIRDILNLSQVCSAFYNMISCDQVWDYIWKKCRGNFHINLEPYVHFFGKFYLLHQALLRRTRICQKCNKTISFGEDVEKPDNHFFSDCHKLSNYFINLEPIEIQTIKPTEGFKQMREFLLNHKIPFNLNIWVKIQGASFFSCDNNFITLSCKERRKFYSAEDFLEYINLMYSC